MSLSTVTITFDVHQLLGGDFDARRTKCRVYTNVENQTLIDTSTNEIRMGDQTVTVGSDGTGTFDTWAPGASGNPASWQTYVAFDYPRTGARDRVTRTFGPYTITASGSLADLEEEQAIPAEYATLLVQQLQALVDEATEITGLDTVEDAVTTLALDPNDVGYDIVILAGQSNMLGAGTPADVDRLDPRDSRVFSYPSSGTYVSQIVQAYDPLAHNPASSGVGPGMAFARSYARGIPQNRSVLLVPCAVSGSSFGSGQWDAAGSSNLYTTMLTAANNALTAANNATNGKSRIAGLLWHQGEGDLSMNEATYAGHLDALINGFRAGVTGAASAWVVVGQMVPEYVASGVDADYGVNTAHVETPYRKTLTGFAYGPGGYQIDPVSNTLHYNAAGARLLGRSMYDAWLMARKNIIGVDPLAPSGVLLEQSGTSVIATWTRPLSRVTDYSVQYRINSGSWTALTRARSIDAIATITGRTAGQTVEVRVATVNEDGTSDWSTPSSALTVIAVPGQTVGVTAGTPQASLVPLSWTATATATSYKVEYRVTSVGGAWTTFSTTITGTSTSVTGLTPSTGYDFRVTPHNVAGYGTASATTTATTANVAGILDDMLAAEAGLSSAYRAVGLRRLRAAYSGSACRIRRSSDNTETDIGFVGAALDTAAITTFVGANSAYVTKMYDQSGNSRDYAQTTTTKQPRIVNAGTLDTLNSKPCMVFDGTDDFLYDGTNAGLTAAGASTALIVAQLTTHAATAVILAETSKTLQPGPYNWIAWLGSGAAPLYTSIKNDAGTQLQYAQSATNITDNIAHVLCTKDTGTSLVSRKDGTAGTTTTYTRAGSTFTVNQAFLGAYAVGNAGTATGNHFAGKISEVITYGAAANSSSTGAGEANAKSYYGTP